MTAMNWEIISFAFWCFGRGLQQVSNSRFLSDLLFDQNCVFIILSAHANLLENTRRTQKYV